MGHFVTKVARVVISKTSPCERARELSKMLEILNIYISKEELIEISENEVLYKETMKNLEGTKKERAVRAEFNSMRKSRFLDTFRESRLAV